MFVTTRIIEFSVFKKKTCTAIQSECVFPTSLVLSCYFYGIIVILKIFSEHAYCIFKLSFVVWWGNQNNYFIKCGPQ